MAAETIRDRVTSLLVASPFSFKLAPAPDSFDAVPLEQIDTSFRVEVVPTGARGASAYTEFRIDEVRITVARVGQADPNATYRALLVDVSSISSAVIRDGAASSGDFDVLDEGRAVTFDHQPGAAYSTATLIFPVEYEAQL